MTVDLLGRMIAAAWMQAELICRCPSGPMTHVVMNQSPLEPHLHSGNLLRAVLSTLCAPDDDRVGIQVWS